MTHKQREFLRFYATGMNAKDSAIAAGYSPKSARAYVYDLVHAPAVKAELAKIAERVREKASFEAVEAFAETERLKAAAEKAGQYQAAARFHEFGLKLSGLLTDKIEVKSDVPDVAGVLAEMQARRLAMRPMPAPALTHDAEFTELPSTAGESAVTGAEKIPARWDPLST